MTKVNNRPFYLKEDCVEIYKRKGYSVNLSLDLLSKKSPSDWMDVIDETAVSGGIDSYDVPYADGNGKHRTDIPPEKRTMKNLPLDKKKKPLVNIGDWLKIKEE